MIRVSLIAIAIALCALVSERYGASASADGAESIRAECPGKWHASRDPKGWRYLCPTTQTEILCVDGPHGCGLRGTVKGDKSAAWVK